MERKVFFTADTHFFHLKVARLRGYDNVHDMNENIIDSWNLVVKDEGNEKDIVYLLGDVSFGKSDETTELITTRLNGEIHLIPGNHDDKRPVSWWKQRVKDVHSMSTVIYLPITDWKEDNHLKILLSHMPNLVGKDPLVSHRYDNMEKPYTKMQGIWKQTDTDFNLNLHGHTHERDLQEKHYVNVGIDKWNMKPISRQQVIEIWKERRKRKW